MSTKNTSDQLRQRLELRRSGASGKHQDKRTARHRTRSDRKRAAIGEQR